MHAAASEKILPNGHAQRNECVSLLLLIFLLCRLAVGRLNHLPRDGNARLLREAGNQRPRSAEVLAEDKARHQRRPECGKGKSADPAELSRLHAGHLEEPVVCPQCRKQAGSRRL